MKIFLVLIVALAVPSHAEWRLEIYSGKSLLQRVESSIEHNLSWDSLPSDDQTFFQETFGLHSIRDALMKFLSSQYVKAICFGHPLGWHSFLTVFSRVVADCPLRLKGANYIDNVTLEIVPGNAVGTRLDLEWTFTRKDVPNPFRWISPSYFEIPSFHLGRSGRVVDEHFEFLLREAGLMKPWE